MCAPTVLRSACRFEMLERRNLFSVDVPLALPPSEDVVPELKVIDLEGPNIGQQVLGRWSGGFICTENQYVKILLTVTNVDADGRMIAIVSFTGGAFDGKAVVAEGVLYHRGSFGLHFRECKDFCGALHGKFYPGKGVMDAYFNCELEGRTQGHAMTFARSPVKEPQSPIGEILTADTKLFS